MKIKNSTPNNIDEIFNLYEMATKFQKQKLAVHWSQFELELIEEEIAENRQWNISENDQIICIWATAFSDPQIWGERNSDPSIYIHRIATHVEFKGRNLVKKIVDWAIKYAKENKKEFIRMDTVGENQGLISYYQKCGFDFIGLRKIQDAKGLPQHYLNATVCLFELKIV
ncbi:GNAT family N-acetyltransferase [Tenacibaculum xiamenense]|uniref:GNAT family N-acetyltransferase n=1 Tax=Tenacibaculum xiamenense TaxID=1261553 RepID=UPI003892F187